MDRVESLMMRAANMIAYGATRDEVRAALVADGASNDLALLIYCMGAIVVGRIQVAAPINER